MNYVINKEIVFSPEKRALLSVENNEVLITLSNQATRLLIEFIKGNKKPITKENLLKNVWEDYGLTPSNNNLYMAVSEIRKSFVNLGVNEVIILTIPKTGFVFSASVDILEPSKESGEGLKKQTTKKTKPNLIHIMILIMVAVFIFITFIYFNKKTNKFDNILTEEKIASPENYGECTFYPLNKDSEKNLTKVIDILKERGSLGCDAGRKSIFYQTNNEHFTFIATCNGDDKNLKECESYRITVGI
ncbi:winged helix-turn-helix domain-containing protein [Serratia ureilytica]|uniref:winged helix-turn-helix domain-containing protein n=1 Tax=Serratia ureilytica TaxID=300181 RepID=UPI001C117068|nr:winged helix-turn-helix domain-containing protein [Serratia ureilytica]MBU5412433.1 winged helix-turn-helix domain-containing protein [Serratia ureilytica]